MALSLPVLGRARRLLCLGKSSLVPSNLLPACQWFGRASACKRSLRWRARVRGLAPVMAVSCARIQCCESSYHSHGQVAVGQSIGGGGSCGAAVGRRGWQSHGALLSGGSSCLSSPRLQGAASASVVRAPLGQGVVLLSRQTAELSERLWSPSGTEPFGAACRERLCWKGRIFSCCSPKVGEAVAYGWVSGRLGNWPRLQGACPTWRAEGRPGARLAAHGFAASASACGEQRASSIPGDLLQAFQSLHPPANRVTKLLKDC